MSELQQKFMRRNSPDSVTCAKAIEAIQFQAGEHKHAEAPPSPPPERAPESYFNPGTMGNIGIGKLGARRGLPMLPRRAPFASRRSRRTENELP